LAATGRLRDGEASTDGATNQAGDGAASGAGGAWVVSEVEAGWPECFFRASPGLARDAALALLQHVQRDVV